MSNSPSKTATAEHLAAKNAKAKDKEKDETETKLALADGEEEMKDAESRSHGCKASRPPSSLCILVILIYQ